MDYPNYNIVQDTLNRLSDELNNKLDNLIIEGLKLKGFEFENKIELFQFVKDRCRCEDNADFKERIYYVDSTPFFLHNYEIKLDTTPIIEDRKTTMSASYGSYAYL